MNGSAAASAPPPEGGHEWPGRARLGWWSILAIGVAVVALYGGLPRVAGLDETWGRLSEGDPRWLAAAALLEVASYAGYVLLFRRVFVTPGGRIGWRESYQITMAGVAATRLLATAGAGGMALTGWALSRSGMERGELAGRLTTFYVSLYGWFMAALVVFGAGLYSGILPGTAPFGVTVVPAIFGGVVIVVALVAALLPRDLDRTAGGRPAGRERLGRWLRTAAAAAATVAAGVRGSLVLLRDGNAAMLGAAMWWAFDIAVLWACFHAFGEPPTVPVLVMAYFTGMLGNLLPLPGGIGGVEGGMIAALLAFGVSGSLAVVVVLTYRAFAFWLPTLPGALAYLQLRHTVKSWEAAGPRGGSLSH